MNALILALALQGAAPAAESPAPPPPDPVASEIIRMGISESRTVMLIDVGNDGRIADCTIEEPSGSDFLDRRACELIREHGRFTPRRDPATGRALAYQIRQRVVWRIEE